MISKLALIQTFNLYRYNEGSAEKEKVYSALCWSERRLGPEDIAKLSAVTDLVAQQATPVRLLHRRSPRTRPRTIHKMTAVAVPNTPHFFELHLRTQAGLSGCHSRVVSDWLHHQFYRVLTTAK